MLYRSYQYMLQKQNMLILGGSDEEKLKSCDWAAKLGINLIFPENETPSTSFKFPSQFLGIDLDKEAGELENSLAIIEGIRQHQLTIHGVISLEDEYLALATLVATFLPTPNNSYEIVSLIKSQLLTSKKILLDDFKKLTFEARKFSHGVEVFALNSLHDIHKIPICYYPLLIKSDSANSGFVAKIVPNQEKLLACFAGYQEEFHSTLDSGIKLGLDDRLIATPYLNGLPQDLLIILSQGELLAGYLIPPFATESNQPQYKTEILNQERQENLIYAAWKVCRNLNLKEGIFYVQGISTELGAKIVNIDISPGKMELVQWMFNVWDIDLILYSCIITFGFKPYINDNSAAIKRKN